MQNDANSTTVPIVADTFWNEWNTGARREVGLDEVSHHQSAMILDRLRAFDPTDLQIQETGCGSGWMCERISAFGHVSGADFADEVIAKAQTRVPHVKFIAGARARTSRRICARLTVSARPWSRGFPPRQSGSGDHRYRAMRCVHGE